MLASAQSPATILDVLFFSVVCLPSYAFDNRLDAHACCSDLRPLIATLFQSPDVIAQSPGIFTTADVRHDILSTNAAMVE